MSTRRNIKLTYGQPVQLNDAGRRMRVVKSMSTDLLLHMLLCKVFHLLTAPCRDNGRDLNPTVSKHLLKPDLEDADDTNMICIIAVH